MRTMLARCAVFVGFLVPACAMAQAADAGAVRVEPEPQAGAPQAKAASARTRPRATNPNAIGLPPPSEAELAQVGPPRKQGQPTRIGFGRAVGGALAWEETAEGTQLASVRITSPGASALRIGVRVDAIPEAATLRFYSGDGSDLQEATGGEVLDALALNLEAGDHGNDARTYWSPPIESDTVTMEIELPAGAERKDLRIAVPHVSHLVASARNGFALPTAKAAAACHNDATCHAGAWGTQMNAVARMVFTSAGASYLCTGTLLADQDPSTQVPYFLTANHCIGMQTEASTLVTYWFYRSSACGGGAGPYQTRTGGATLLFNSSATDVSFLRLNATPPTGAVYAGWTLAAPTQGTAVTAIHHPTGDLLKISFGSVLAFINCTAPSSGQFSCSNGTPSSSGYYDVGWNSGITQGGSSGSALFDGGRYVVGQLYGGSSSCSDPGAGDSYGRFDVSYRNGLSRWLAAPPVQPPVPLTVTLAGAGSGTVTSSPAGIACPGMCSATFPVGTTVTLAATPGALSWFSGWFGACSGTAACSVPLTAERFVDASFLYAGAAWPAGDVPAAAFVPGGGGWSLVSGSPGGATFEGATAYRSDPIPDGGVATLTYSGRFEAGNVAFARRVSSQLNGDFLRFLVDGVQVAAWSGEVPWSIVTFPVPAGTHTLSWTYDKVAAGVSGQDAAWIDAVNLPANEALPFALTVTPQGTGPGVVRSVPAGLECPPACSAEFAPGTVVALTGEGAPGARFDGWAGACSGASGCSVPLLGPRAATATFTQVAGTHKKRLKL